MPALMVHCKRAADLFFQYPEQWPDVRPDDSGLCQHAAPAYSCGHTVDSCGHFHKSIWGCWLLPLPFLSRQSKIPALFRIMDFSFCRAAAYSNFFGNAGVAIPELDSVDESRRLSRGRHL